MFTATELQIAKLLLNGGSVADIGIQRRQSDDTIRWHVRNMMAKVGARSLADLHRMLALLIPM
jgi:DNA-binding NarL/FixJ family response regulator